MHSMHRRQCDIFTAYFMFRGCHNTEYYSHVVSSNIKLNLSLKSVILSHCFGQKTDIAGAWLWHSLIGWRRGMTRRKLTRTTTVTSSVERATATTTQLTWQCGLPCQTEDSSRKKIIWALDISNMSCLLTVFMLFYADDVKVKMVETDWCYHQYLRHLVITFFHSLIWMNLKRFFLAVMMQMEHCLWDSQMDYWSSVEQF